jgi:hypothetical protein
MIKRSIVTALLVGHANPCSTIADYFHPADDEAGQFLKDYMLIGERQLTLELFVKKWMPGLTTDHLRGTWAALGLPV